MATLAIKIPRWDIEEETGYKPFTTFWQDFSIADTYGLQAIQDTFNRAFDAWKDNYKYLTELVLVLNHKIFHHYVEKGTEEENEKGLTVTRYINQENLKGKYSIYLSIDGKIYNTEEYVNFSQE